jgi:hypothetical protein
MLTAVCAGLIFARVAHPRRAARALFVSDAACVARPAAAAPPTLAFRVLDTRPDRARGPTVTAHLFRWAPRTAGGGEGGGSAGGDGDAAAWRVDELALAVNGKPLGAAGALPPLLLPVTLEHVIGPDSPLAGETLASLVAACAEVVVTLAAPTPRGDAVAVRSYLATELYWGCAFVPAVRRRAGGGGGGGGAGYAVDVAAFHRVAPLPGTDGATPAQLADDVLGGVATV